MLKKIMLPALLVMGMSAHAEDATKGLIGVQVGYVGTNWNVPTADGGGTKDVGGPSIGLKFGAEGDFYRVFIDTNYWYTDEYHSAGTIGGALQYLIRPAKVFNIFVGLNAGFINTAGTVTDANPYYGGDLGVNINFGEKFGLEIGGRAAAVDSHDKDGTARNYYQGYVSAIFKFTQPY